MPDYFLRRSESSSSVGKSWISDIFTRAISLRGEDRVEHPTNQDPTFYATTCEKARAVASLKPMIYQGDPLEDESAKPLGAGHPLWRLLKRPNPWMTWSQLAYAGVVHYQESGEDLWFLFPSGEETRGRPLEEEGPISVRDIGAIWPVSGNDAELDKGQDGIPKTWKWGLGDRERAFAVPYGAAVHFKSYNPRDPFRGLAPAEVARASMHLAWQAKRYQEAILRNGGDPGGTFLFDGPPPKDPEERKALEREANADTGPHKAGHKRVTWGESPQYIPNPIAPKDMDYETLLRYVREEIASINGVPLLAIGAMESATYSNLEEALVEKWRKVTEYVRAFEDVFNYSFLGRLRDPELRGTVFRYDMSMVEVLREDISEKIRLAKELSVDTGMGMRTAARVAQVPVETDDLPDIAFASGGLQTISAVERAGEMEGPIEPTEPTEPTEPDINGRAAADPTQTLNGAQMSSVMELIEAVGEGRIPKQSAIEALNVALPVDRASIVAIFASVVEGATKPAETQPPPARQEPANERALTGKAFEQKSPACRVSGESVSECVSRKVPEILEERPGIDRDQAVAIASSLCEDPCGDKAFEGRREYYKQVMDPVFVRTEKSIHRVAERQLTKYSKALFKRLEDFAKRGEAALRSAGNVLTKQDEEPEIPAASLTEELIAILLLSEPEWVDKFFAAFEGVIEDAWLEGAQSAANEIGVSPADITQTLLDDQRQTLATEIAKTLGKESTEAILRVFKDDETVSTLQEHIRRHLEEIQSSINQRFGSTEARASRIAQTESGAAVNGSRFDQFRKHGVKRHEWVNSNDEVVRPRAERKGDGGHRAIDGQIVEIGERFTDAKGRKIPGLTHPSAPNAPPGWRINCRCAARAIVENDSEAVNAS